MSYRKPWVILALVAICAQAQAQPEPPRYRFERVPTDDPSCASSGSEALDLNNAGAVIGGAASIPTSSRSLHTTATSHCCRKTKKVTPASCT